MAIAIRTTRWTFPKGRRPELQSAAGAISVELPPPPATPVAASATASRLRCAWSWLRSRRVTDAHVVALVASMLSIGAYVYYTEQNETLAYTDAISHLMIAHRVLAARTPGLAQLGTNWLPLHHLLMAP